MQEEQYISRSSHQQRDLRLPQCPLQPCTNVTSPGLISEEKLRKFKYEPLEDDTDCWGGMLFEQDLYGRMFRGNYGQPRVNSHRLSLKSEETTGNNITFKNSGPKMCLDSEMSVTDLLNMANITSPNPDIRVLDTFSGPVEEEVEPDPTETCINNNVSFSLTLGDLNMNVNHLDFSFIDSDGSSQSEVVDTLKGINSLGGTLPPPTEDSLTTVYHEDTTPEDMFTLKDTYISDMDSSFAVTASSNSLCKPPSACEDNCQECRCELNNVSPHGHSRTNSREVTELLPQSQTSNSPDLETGSKGEKATGDNDFKKTQKDFDDNGNPEAKLGTLKQTQVFSGVVSARFRPKGVSRQNSSGSPNSQNKSEDKEFEQLLSLVQNISQVREGPLSYQPTKSALSSLLALDKQTDLQVDSTHITSQRSSKENTTSLLPENCATGKPSEISFEDLHAKVAPNSRSPSKSKIGQSLQEPEPSSPSTPSALSLSADAQAELHPTPVCCPSIHPSSMGPSAGDSTTLAVAPYTSSYSTTSTTDQPLVDARHSLLPEEIQPANNLPHQESRPHPVKPLTSSQSEKKDGRSVLEKLKSTIHPGRTAHQVVVEPERSQEVTVDNSAQYQHLTNMELISLLLQQEMDMQKQQAASEQQEAQLEKCEAELKKVKAQVRDLEDYIDNLLLRIMEQTPTLLQLVKLGRPRYDQSSFLGRLRHFIDIIDPSTLFVSERRLKECIKLLDDYNHGTLPPGVSDLQLWEAQKIKQAIIHPDTGEKIFMPFRMSGYVPFGTPIVIGLLLPNQTVVSTIIWQWLNQSHNACVNYANRNATKPTPTSKFLQGYVGAVTSAVSIAVSFSFFCNYPWRAVTSANICNVGLMRHNELSEGIDVLDNNGNVVGSSKIAARHAITETAFTRVVLPMPIFVLPPIIMSYLERLRFLQSNRRLLLPIHSLVCLVTFGLSLPVAISLFPQMSQIEVSRLEPEIAMATDCKVVTYNKGL
ncbi:hypothetical protein INR49_013514 [Caranx melampygus]|nr:hypothetical protein INR49_013514 [Caranx melampygus]